MDTSLSYYTDKSNRHCPNCYEVKFATIKGDTKLVKDAIKMSYFKGVYHCSRCNIYYKRVYYLPQIHFVVLKRINNEELAKMEDI